MLITAVDHPQIRRLEAVSFRSYPATTTYFNGTWAVRLTAGLPAKRLNSVSPLDPYDGSNLELRIEQELKRYHNFGRPAIFRLTPLAPKALVSLLKLKGWELFDESIVMMSDLDTLLAQNTFTATPISDTGYWVDSVLKLGNEDPSIKPGKVEVIEAISGKVGLFLLSDDNGVPQCALRVVLDNELVGLFSIVTSASNQRAGLATKLITSALSWAREQGASHAWLQVESANTRAISLYQKLGFSRAYQYVYARASSATREIA